MLYNFVSLSTAEVMFLKKSFYCRFNVNERQTLFLGDVQTLLQSHFNASWPVKIYCGGYCGYCDNGPMRERE